MVDFPDVYCYIKLINRDTMKAFDSGTTFFQNEANNGATIRYVVVNDSNKATGNFVVTGALYKDGVKIVPNPVPALTLTLGSKQAWTHEHSISNPKPNSASYEARILGDIGNMNIEETEKNNKATATFKFTQTFIPK